MRDSDPQSEVLSARETDCFCIIELGTQRVIGMGMIFSWDWQDQIGNIRNLCLYLSVLLWFHNQLEFEQGSRCFLWVSGLVARIASDQKWCGSLGMPYTWDPAFETLGVWSGSPSEKQMQYFCLLWKSGIILTMRANLGQLMMIILITLIKMSAI